MIFLMPDSLKSLFVLKSRLVGMPCCTQSGAASALRSPGQEKFLDACRVFQNQIWATPKDWGLAIQPSGYLWLFRYSIVPIDSKDSCMKRRLPRAWEEQRYTWLRHGTSDLSQRGLCQCKPTLLWRNIVWEPRELPTFDVFMNQALRET